MLKIKNYIILFILIGTVAVYPQVTVTLPNVSGLLNTEVLAPVTVNDLSGLNIASFQFQVNYDQTKITILGVSTTGTILNGASPTLKNDVPGYIRIAFASASNLSGSGTLLNLRIKFIADGSSPLTYTAQDGFFKSEFGSGGITVTPVNGTATSTTTNLPPVFDAVPNKSIKAGQTLTFGVHATDPEGQPLIYATGTLPQGAAFNASTQQFTWTPTQQQLGTYSVIFIANDGTNSAQVTVSIEVLDSNTPPQINAIPDKNVKEGENVSFFIEATDAESDPLHYSSSTLPAGALFDTTSHFFYWTPDFTQQGTYNITFTVNDGKASSNITVKITVANVNQAPSFTKTMSAQTIDVNVPPVQFSFQYEASDPDNDALTYSLDVSPTGSAISSTGLFTWSPSTDQAGSVFTVTVRVSDGSLSNTTSSTITTNKDVVSVRGDELPTVTSLYQNYPNPFNPTTTIEYSLMNDSYVSISVFNILGQEVSTLVNSFNRAGYHSIRFNGENLESGIYIYRLTAGNIVEVKRMMLLK